MRNPKIFFAVLVLCCSLVSCYKDKGNYNYHPVNEVNFSGIDTAVGYTLYFGDTLSINPQLKGTQDPDGTGKQYAYEWSIDLSGTDTVLSKEKNLHVRILLTPGKYTLQYKATDLQTGIRFHTRTQLLVVTKVFEGYLVMCDVNGHTRLDMLSYNRTAGNFQQLPDVLTRMNSSAPVQGKPRQVFCMETEVFAVTPKTYRIYLLTDAGAYKIDPETFGYNSLGDFRYEMVGTLPAGFAPTSLTGSLQYLFMPTTFMTEGNNIYRRTYQSNVFPYVPVNTYAGDPKPFKAFPQVTCYDDGFTIFNMDKRVFATGSPDGVNVTDLTADLGFPEGKDMVYMEDQLSTGLGYAVMKDPGVASYYLVRFYPGYSFADYFEPMAATEIAGATHFAMSPELGYVFYSVGGRLYEYDPFLQKSFLMLDKGLDEITYLSFQRFFNPNMYDTYTRFGNLLTVGSVNPNGTEGANGTLEQFTVPPINKPLQRTNSWTGFGKIVSVSYRERN